MSDAPENPNLPTGRIGFRTDPELHARLLEISRALGIDLSGLLNMLIRSSLPMYTAFATRVSRSTEAAETLWVQRLKGNIDEDLLRQVMLLSSNEQEELWARMLEEEREEQEESEEADDSDRESFRERINRLMKDTKGMRPGDTAPRPHQRGQQHGKKAKSYRSYDSKRRDDRDGSSR